MMDALDEARRRQLVDWFEQSIPFNVLLGIKVEQLSRGYCVLRVPWREDFIGDTDRPAVHGGVISSLLDTAGGAACFSMLDRVEDRVSTVDIRIDYLQPGPSTDLLCESTIVRMGNRVAAARMEVFGGRLPAGDARPRNPIATGQGVYSILRRSES